MTIALHSTPGSCSIYIPSVIGPARVKSGVKRIHIMLRWITAISVLLILAYLTVGYLYGVSLRHAGILEGRAFLKIAAKDFAEYGYVTNIWSSSYRFSRSTNVVTIGSTQYQCYAEIAGGKFYDEGTLAITTNQTFIWLDSKRPPKIIEPSYKPPLFPPRF